MVFLVALEAEVEFRVPLVVLEQPIKVMLEQETVVVVVVPPLLAAVELVEVVVHRA
jgi:hypothetical protein